jgi:tetratricopeptide (TPR) repeat protein
VWLHLRRTEEAIRDFNELVRLCPDSVQALLVRSAGWTYIGRPHDAERDLKEATRLAPEQAHELRQQQLLMEASAAEQAQDFNTSIAKATELLDAAPDHAAALRIRAGSHWYAEHFVEALDDFTRLLDLDGAQEDITAILSARGQVYGELGEYELALDDLNRAVESARREQNKVLLAYSLNGRGMARVGMQDFAAADRDFQESLALCPNNAWLHYNLGLLGVAQGQPAAAVAAFRQALTCDNPQLSPRKKQKARQYVTAYGS